MNMKKLNKKGFTLVELLAVIIVLAVVMLIAVTAVVPQMNRSRKQAFITEATTILNGAENYFVYKEATGTKVTCATIQTDIIGDYISEKGKGKYQGVVEEVTEKDASNNDVKRVKISLTNGAGYWIVTYADAIAGLGESAVVETAPTGFKTSCS